MRMAWPMLASMVFAATLLPHAADAQTVAPPHIDANDSWTYEETVENAAGWHQTRVETTVLRVGATSIAISTKPVGSTMPPVEQLTGVDWSRVRSVNGHETVVNRPLSFPLSVGKSWEVTYTEDHPNRTHSSERVHTPYKVVGWEDLAVPAGTFHALKIEAEGDWSANIAPGISSASGARVDAQGSTIVSQIARAVPATISGRTYKAFWYVPAVKRWVQTIEEYYDVNGRRTESHTDKLTEYKVAP